MTSRILDEGLTLRVIEVGFNWTDTAGLPITRILNLSGKRMIFARAEVVNGGTAATTTAPVVTVSTPNTDYTITCSSTMAANGVQSIDSLGEDPILPYGSLSVVLTTAPSAAKEAKVRLFIWML